LLACGFTENEARSSVRFSLGRITTDEEIKYVLTVLPEAVAKVKKLNI